jgi:hypothetical protein
MNTLTRRLLWVVIGFGLIVSARANSVVFSTLGPGDSFDTTASWAIEAVGSPLLIAAQFTAQASGNLRTVDLGMSFDQFFGPGMFNVYLYNDAGGAPDSTNPIFLGSDGLSGTFHFSTLISLPISGSVSVSAGSSYWLSLQPAFENAWSFWDFSSPLLLGTVDYSRDGTTWFLAGTSQEMPAFRLTATSTVPDSSSTIILLAYSSFVLLGLRRYA